MSFVIHEVSAVESPQLDRLVVRARGKTLHLWHGAETTDDVGVSFELFELLSVAPHLNNTSLVTCDNCVVNLYHGCCMGVSSQLLSTISSLEIPDAHSTIPTTTQQFILAGMED